MAKNRIQNQLIHKPANGTLLVATPSLDDSSFCKTVILLLQHNEQGSFGVVLNRPANEKILSAWTQLAGVTSDEKLHSDLVSEHLVNGGPVGGPVFAIHQLQQIGEMEMPGGIFVSAQSENLKQLVREDVDQYKIVFGISSWAVGQLQDEINSGCWFTVDATAEHVFGDMEWMWEEQLRRYGQDVTRRVLGLKSLAANPELN